MPYQRCVIMVTVWITYWMHII